MSETSNKPGPDALEKLTGLLGERSTARAGAKESPESSVAPIESEEEEAELPDWLQEDDVEGVPAGYKVEGGIDDEQEPTNKPGDKDTETTEPPKPVVIIPAGVHVPPPMSQGGGDTSAYDNVGAPDPQPQVSETPQSAETVQASPESLAAWAASMQASIDAKNATPPPVNLPPQTEPTITVEPAPTTPEPTLMHEQPIGPEPASTPGEVAAQIDAKMQEQRIRFEQEMQRIVGEIQQAFNNHDNDVFRDKFAEFAALTGERTKQTVDGALEKQRLEFQTFLSQALAEKEAEIAALRVDLDEARAGGTVATPTGESWRTRGRDSINRGRERVTGWFGGVRERWNNRGQRREEQMAGLRSFFEEKMHQGINGFSNLESFGNSEEEQRLLAQWKAEWQNNTHPVVRLSEFEGNLETYKNDTRLKPEILMLLFLKGEIGSIDLGKHRKAFEERGINLKRVIDYRKEERSKELKENNKGQWLNRKIFEMVSYSMPFDTPVDEKGDYNWSGKSREDLGYWAQEYKKLQNVLPWNWKGERGDRDAVHYAVYTPAVPVAVLAPGLLSPLKWGFLGAGWLVSRSLDKEMLKAQELGEQLDENSFKHKKTALRVCRSVSSALGRAGMFGIEAELMGEAFDATSIALTGEPTQFDAIQNYVYGGPAPEVRTQSTAEDYSWSDKIREWWNSSGTETTATSSQSGLEPSQGSGGWVFPVGTPDHDMNAWYDSHPGHPATLAHNRLVGVNLHESGAVGNPSENLLPVDQDPTQSSIVGNPSENFAPNVDQVDSAQKHLSNVRERIAAQQPERHLGKLPVSAMREVNRLTLENVFPGNLEIQGSNLYQSIEDFLHGHVPDNWPPVEGYSQGQEAVYVDSLADYLQIVYDGKGIPATLDLGNVAGLSHPQIVEFYRHLKDVKDAAEYTTKPIEVSINGQVIKFPSMYSWHQSNKVLLSNL